ncbi:hypothetical protein CBOM_08069 [Ceraceosorus bombacis]|uniref:Uncharacterized protein n=1 Tax=Ceraceosorus bombacis TaxID=401625 RepID=A0A0P1BRY5_9BASI|nr:hypothetical protein CBOM_08069 [Ceraceosorus bombacis]
MWSSKGRGTLRQGKLGPLEPESVVRYTFCRSTTTADSQRRKIANRLDATSQGSRLSQIKEEVTYDNVEVAIDTLCRCGSAESLPFQFDARGQRQ